jgi:transcriptional regulator with XRE-family HTH domain
MTLDSSDSTTATSTEAPTTNEPELRFGSYVRRLRRAAGVRPVELAKRMGVDDWHWARVESGSRPPTPPSTWGALLDIGADEHELRVLAERYWAERAGRRRGRRADTERGTFAPGHPHSSTWDDLPWEEDDWCWYVVTHQPDGLSQEEVALLTGWSHAKVRSIEESALAKLRRDPDARELFESLLLACQERDLMLHAALAESE